MGKINNFIALTLMSASFTLQAAPKDTELAVWANEAIVASYSYNYKNFMDRQKEIAKYFTAAGWTDYSTVFKASKIPETVQANSYYVSAVATLPPQVKGTSAGHWQVKMPLLVVYKNPQYQQKQTLNITLDFGEAPSGQGVRGMAITSLQALAASPPCQCEAEKSKDETTKSTDPQQSQDVK